MIEINKNLLTKTLCIYLTENNQTKKRWLHKIIISQIEMKRKKSNNSIALNFNGIRHFMCARTPNLF